MKNNLNPVKPILALATAGLKSDQIFNITTAKSPRVDYLELKRFIDLDVLNYSVYDRTWMGKHLRSLETKLRSDLYLTLMALRARDACSVVFAMSERAGIPFAFLQQFLSHKKALVAMFTSWSWRQEAAITKLNLFQAMDHIIVKSQALKRHFLTLGAPPERITVIPFGVDHLFFTPENHAAQENNVVMTVGEIKNRDYATLFHAVDGSDVRLLAAVSGNWYAREKDTTLHGPMPGNVMVSRHLPSTELRAMYARSQFVVVPLFNTPHSAGATSILEAMSMGRAVITSRSEGIQDYVIDGETGILVEPGNVQELRDAINHLLDHPQEADKLGRAARKRIEEELNMDVYVRHITETLRGFQEGL